MSSASSTTGIDRRSITAAGAPPAVGPYTHAVLHGDTLYCSGALPLDPATGAVTDESLAAETATARGHASGEALEHLARRGAELGEAEIGIAVRARPRGADTAISVVVAGPGWVHRERRMVFLGGSNGRIRAGLAAVHILLTAIRAH